MDFVSLDPLSALRGMLESVTMAHNPTSLRSLEARCGELKKLVKHIPPSTMQMKLRGVSKESNPYTIVTGVNWSISAAMIAISKAFFPA